MITKNFSWNEVTASSTAKKLGIDNSIPNEDVKQNLLNLFREVVQPARDYLGIPIQCNSVYRCDALNKAVGGVKTSHHRCQNGYAAADLSCSSNLRLFNYIKDNLEFTQLIKYPNFVHVSYNENDLRNQIIIK